MPYETAINKCWEDLSAIAGSDKYTVSLLSDTYEVNLKDKSVYSNSCNAPTKEYLTILILHYLIGFLKNVYMSSGEWVSFKEIQGGEIYYPAFRKGAIETILRKYGSSPQELFKVLERFKGAKIDSGDVAIEITTFPDVYLRIIVWKQDSEFGPEATILFDKNITKIYTMEDIVVFSHFITAGL